MIDNVNKLQVFLPSGSSLVESRPQKGRRTALLANFFFLSEISNFFLMEQKSVLASVCWLVKFQIGIQNFFRGTKTVACLGLLIGKFQIRIQIFFTEQKSMLAWVCYMYEWSFDGSFVPVGFSRTGIERLKNRSETGPKGIDGLKNRSGKCEGSGGGARRVKKPEWQMRKTGWGEGSTGLNQTLLK
jgi:hypothetical protein